ncbi:MAG: EutN/CcmL family microcompartment protein [Myxococcales bacterium]|nr:EutN/CcmL family microcompartment protein [Myxococcales bacterium]
MQLGRITGTVVATRKDENLEGLRFLVVNELSGNMVETGKIVVAADAVGAGVGEVVLYAQGSSARQTIVTKDRPVDATIMAIVDLFEVNGEFRYRKE